MAAPMSCAEERATTFWPFQTSIFHPHADSLAVPVSIHCVLPVVA
jgi:hypothetical protein